LTRIGPEPEQPTERSASPLTFRCTSCGNCCRSLRVAVTSFDVARLVTATGWPPGELVAWLAPDSVDMAGEPQSFVELDAGRRLMVLDQRGGACRVLGADNLCGAYSARPRDCRAYPFDFVSAVSGAPPGRHLSLLPLLDCAYASDGQNDATLLEAEDRARWNELRSYQALVARWNRRAWHRRRLHKGVGGARQFLEFALASPCVCHN